MAEDEIRKHTKAAISAATGKQTRLETQIARNTA